MAVTVGPKGKHKMPENGVNQPSKALKLMCAYVVCVCVFAFRAIKMVIESASNERKSMDARIFFFLRF